jgi:hypothetical protein
MNSALPSIIGTLIRWLLTSGIAFLLAHKVLTQEQASEVNITAIVTWAVPLLIPLLWALWVRLRSKFKLKLALNMNAGSTEAQVDKVVAQTNTSTIIKSALAKPEK